MEADMADGKSTPLRVALYARVSTIGSGQSPEMQLGELRDYCERRGWQIADEYIDSGVSGAKDSRPELNRLMSDAYRRHLDTILVWKLDRFGRSLRHLVNALAELEARGVAFVSLRDNLDLSTPSGRLMFQIIGAMAEFERSLIAERVKAGMRNARAKGRRIGRPSRTPITEELKSEISAAYQRGEGSFRSLAAQFGCSLGTVQRSIAAYQRSGSRPALNADTRELF
jgi:DNA invertase Pin-like site-specific DNA recombinase